MIKYLLEPEAQLPEKGTEQSSGYDLRPIKIIKVYRGVEEIPKKELEKMQKEFIETGKVKIKAFNRVLFGTGLKAIIPFDKEINVIPRSGMALKRGLTVINSPGLIDSDYRDEFGVIIINLTPFDNVVFYKERIAQLKYQNKINVKQTTTTLEEFNKNLTSRKGGFGSTGTK